MNKWLLISLALYLMLMSAAERVCAKGEPKEPVLSLKSSVAVIVNIPPEISENWGEEKDAARVRLNDFIADSLRSQLVKQGECTIIDKLTIDDAMAELKFSTTDLHEVQKASLLRQHIGADTIMISTVRNFAGKKVNGAGLIGVGIIPVLSMKKKQFTVSFESLVETVICDVLIHGEGKSRSKSSGIGITLASKHEDIGMLLSKTDFTSSKWTDSTMGKAMHLSIVDMTTAFLRSMPQPIGAIKQDGSIEVLLGKQFNIRKNDIFQIIRITKNENTTNNTSEYEKNIIGEVKVKSVTAISSICRPVNPLLLMPQTTDFAMWVEKKKK